MLPTVSSLRAVKYRRLLPFTEDRALQILMLAKHLIERAQMAEITELAVF